MIGRTGAAMMALAILLQAPVAWSQQRTVPHGTRSSEVIQVKVTVSDFERSLKFYRDGMGLVSAVPSMDISSADKVAWRGDSRAAPMNFTGSMAETYFTVLEQKGVTPKRDQAALIQISFKVKSLEATIARLKAAGFASGPIRELGPNFREANVSDPDGYIIVLIESPTMVASPPS